MSRFDTLQDWLHWLEQLHPKNIDLGLERVYKVAVELDLLNASDEFSQAFSGSLNSPGKDSVSVVTVAGTNGKGSCIVTLEKLLLFNRSPDNKFPLVGSYTSPHLHHYCERIRIDGEPVSEALVCEAFAAIDQARKEISLTYFEFGTLAALWIFVQQQVPYVLLEVGLGGRLDAVNIVDANIAVITSIDIDHQDWLGSDRDGISKEKLGVARENATLIIAEPNFTSSLKEAGKRENSKVIGRDFEFEMLDHFQWRFQLNSLSAELPLPTLPIGSVTAALVALNELRSLPCEKELTSIMRELFLAGRFEIRKINEREIIFDVAHNPAAAEALANRLSCANTSQTRTFAVLALMEDKDHAAILEPMLKLVDTWFLGDLPSVHRAAKAEVITQKLDLMLAAGNSQVQTHCMQTIEEAFNSAFATANTRDRIIVFGSFYTVAAIQAFIDEKLMKNERNPFFPKPVIVQQKQDL